jgi:hypothetical protein
MKDPARFHGIVFCTRKYKHTNTEKTVKKTGNQLVMPSASSPI